MKASSINKPEEFCISHTRSGRARPGEDYYRVKMGSHWEDVLRRELQCSVKGVSQLEGRLIVYDENVFDLVVRKSLFTSKSDKAKQLKRKAYPWSGEGREPGNFLSFRMTDDKVIDDTATEALLQRGINKFKYEPNFQQFTLTRVTPTIAPFNPSSALWDDGYDTKMICMTFDLSRELKQPIKRNRLSAEEKKEKAKQEALLKKAAKDATRELSTIEKNPRPTTNAKQLSLPLAPLSVVTNEAVVEEPAIVEAPLETQIGEAFVSLKAKIVRAAREGKLIVTLEGSGEDVSMTVEQIQRVVYR